MTNNSTLTLLRHRMRQRNISGAVSPQDAILCEIIDHWNDLHFHDRNAYHERIKKLESEVYRLKTRGQSE